MPRLEFVDVAARPAETAGDSATWNVDVTYRNTGGLPTALEQAQLVKIVRPDRVRLQFPDELTEGEVPAAEVVLPEGRDKTREGGFLEPGGTRTLRFKVRTRGDVDPFEITVQVLSTRGGLIQRDVRLGGE